MVTVIYLLISNFIFLNFNKIIKTSKKFNLNRTNFSLKQYYATCDFIDLLLLNLDSGQNLQQAFQLSSNFTLDENLRHSTSRILFHYKLGTPFTTCLCDSLNKQNNPYFTELLETILISLQLGTPTQKALAELSKTLRIHAILKMEEYASAAAVKMVFPLVLFIFPVIFILLGSGSIQDLILSLRF